MGEVKMLILFFIHVFGAIITLIIMKKMGVFKDAAKYGDGIREARPSDVLFLCIVAWEFLAYIFAVEWIKKMIDDHVKKHYERQERGEGESHGEINTKR